MWLYLCKLIVLFCSQLFLIQTGRSCQCIFSGYFPHQLVSKHKTKNKLGLILLRVCLKSFLSYFFRPILSYLNLSKYGCIYA